MRRTTSLAILTIAVLIFIRTPATSGDHGKADSRGASIYLPSALKWHDGPPSLPAGAKLAVLEGDPTKPGPFVMRVKLPDGYRVLPHMHAKPERVTVISGTFYIGMGEKFDRAKGKKMSAGTYGSWPAGMKHFGWVKGETVIQLHGDGPWTIKYLNPADDPRNAEK
jgi:hypothetical protein